MGEEGENHLFPCSIQLDSCDNFKSTNKITEDHLGCKSKTYYCDPHDVKTAKKHFVKHVVIMRGCTEMEIEWIHYQNT